MAQTLDMKRLHQGCGESLQSNLPGIPLLKQPLSPGYSVESAQVVGKVRSMENHQRDESRSK
ncbi:MAG: hypothetical protein LC541_07585 [Candidatus Thiodiazotropha sp.]|nr:hypothetical protein [Candidatus Thiodiazotropha sp.]MCU7838629.1 hypothetical protein [Candidatus Thiodiazotropha sp. (ex Troendleina suluensis)]MCU7857262.1 hypothetical protein [Candidatus Thiodiazotropha sp. (ex Lucinoma borealis)]MCU7883789.1 hypothetical protein [Candidatus Thiodiazotropha sp. (ex Lucinoma annulata)]MCM8883173.1 hypothetical protein [Candidatus Thiodiazotropha sp.]